MEDEQIALFLLGCAIPSRCFGRSRRFEMEPLPRPSPPPKSFPLNQQLQRRGEMELIR